jgi:hypothetical protein
MDMFLIPIRIQAACAPAASSAPQLSRRKSAPPPSCRLDVIVNTKWNKILLMPIVLVLCMAITITSWMTPMDCRAERFAPPAGREGTTAIPMDDPAFVGWAAGYENYLPGTHLDPAWKTPEQAVGKASGTSFNVVSLGRGGQITLSFDPSIQNGEGWDFAVFENAFNDWHLELAYVEVSSNGEDFVRFDSISLTPGPVGGYGSVDAALIDGLAGKYRQGYGTPFDLSDLADKPEVQAGLLDLDRITHVRLIDIIGDGSYLDSRGNPIYDPYPTFDSAGFDLDAIGVSNGAPYPDTGGSNGPPPLPPRPDEEGKEGFGGQGGCFIKILMN